MCCSALVTRLSSNSTVPDKDKANICSIRLACNHIPGYPYQSRLARPAVQQRLANQIMSIGWSTLAGEQNLACLMLLWPHTTTPDVALGTLPHLLCTVCCLCVVPLSEVDDLALARCVPDRVGGILECAELRLNVSTQTCEDVGVCAGLAQLLACQGQSHLGWCMQYIQGYRGK